LIPSTEPEFYIVVEDGSPKENFRCTALAWSCQLAGRSDCPLCYIEVKSSSGDGSDPFPITANEWDKARECHQSADSVDIIVRVAHVRDDPKIADVVIDPFGLYSTGQVGLVTQDMWVYVGPPQSPGTAAGGSRSASE